jgi:ribosomal protein S18 acetylase RimI-like enzyme
MDGSQKSGRAAASGSGRGRRVWKTASDMIIRPIAGRPEMETCARMMAASEPWITLQRDYAASLRNLSSDEKEIHVAARGEHIVGFVALNLHGGFVGYLQSICVAPAWRNRGIGRRLIEFAEERVFREYPNLFICVSSFNPGALRLYRGLGYEVVGELKNYIIDGHSEILLRKSIASLTQFRKTVQASGHPANVRKNLQI